MGSSFVAGPKPEQQPSASQSRNTCSHVSLAADTSKQFRADIVKLFFIDQRSFDIINNGPPPQVVDCRNHRPRKVASSALSSLRRCTTAAVLAKQQLSFPLNAGRVGVKSLLEMVIAATSRLEEPRQQTLKNRYFDLCQPVCSAGRRGAYRSSCQQQRHTSGRRARQVFHQRVGIVFKTFSTAVQDDELMLSPTLAGVLMLNETLNLAEVVTLASTPHESQ